MRMYLYPRYVSLDSAEAKSPHLFKLLSDQKIELVEENWGGTIDTIPVGTPAIIRASSVMRCTFSELGRKCAELGHFCFYDDQVIQSDGSLDYDSLVEEALKFIERNKQNDEMPKDEVVRYLKSYAKDDSTLGFGEHVQRQAKLMLKLWDENVPMSEHVAKAGDFSGAYPIVRIGTPGDTTLGRLGFDLKVLQVLEEAVEADLQRLEGLGLTLTSDDDRSRQLCRKLRNGLHENFFMLGDAVSTTKFMYGMHDTGVAQQLNPLGMLVGTFSSRNNIDATQAGVRRIYHAMLPALVEKLVAAGYPDADEPIEWDYGGPSKAFGLRMLAGGAEAMGVEISHGITHLATATCKQCGHTLEVEIYQELDVDGQTPKGDPEIRGLADACPQCGASNVQK